MKKIIFVLLLVMMGCGSAQFMTEDKGIVIDVGEYWVEVMYQVVDRESRSKAFNTYYKEHGHRYEKGDVYPDNEKEIKF